MFMRPRQRFVWADELKAGLKRLNDYYAPLHDRIGRVGLMRMHEPPKEVPMVVSDLWETCLRLDGVEGESEKPTAPPPSIEQINAIITGAERLPSSVSTQQPDSVILHRRISTRRGSWPLYPLASDEEPAEGEGA